MPPANFGACDCAELSKSRLVGFPRTVDPIRYRRLREVPLATFLKIFFTAPYSLYIYPPNTPFLPLVCHKREAT